MAVGNGWVGLAQVPLRNRAAPSRYQCSTCISALIRAATALMICLGMDCYQLHPVLFTWVLPAREHSRKPAEPTPFLPSTPCISVRILAAVAHTISTADCC